MTVTVNFEAPQIQVSNSSDGIQLSQVILPYSVRSTDDSSQYLGGQITLGQSDGIKLTDNTKDWERIGLAKIKNMVASTEIYAPDQAVESPVSSEADSVASSEAVESSASLEATVASSAAEAPVSSVADSAVAQ